MKNDNYFGIIVLVIIVAFFSFTTWYIFAEKTGVEQTVSTYANVFSIKTVAWYKSDCLYITEKTGSVEELSKIKCIEYNKANEKIAKVKELTKLKCK